MNSMLCCTKFNVRRGPHRPANWFTPSLNVVTLNAVEASHNVLIRFRSKDIFLERLHDQLSTNLGLLQANMTYMHARFGVTYHWIPELYRRMKLPIFEGIVTALEKHNIRRKRLDLAKTTPQKKRIELKMKRVVEGIERIKWS